ncbi:hypothetical protein REPUB_Repub13aG0119800 [Reevesia pubescens]
MMFNERYFGEGRKDGGPGYEVEEEHVESVLFTVLIHLYSFILSDYVPWLRPLDLEGREKIVSEAMRIVIGYHALIIDERVQLSQTPMPPLPANSSLKAGSSDKIDSTEPELRFMSFSIGRRGCMGVALGTEMTIMQMPRLIQGFTWQVPPNEVKIDLSESEDDLFLAKPLLNSALEQEKLCR